MDPEDGLIREIVGPWAKEKHERIEKYVNTYRHVRTKFLTGTSRSATYIELFCGPGRCRIRDTQTVIDGSPLVALRSAQKGGQPFSELHLGDMRGDFVDAACARVRTAGGYVQGYKTAALEAADAVIKNLNPYGLHFIVLDPYKLESLSFELIKKLSVLKHVDMLLHVSAMDLTRNLDKYIDDGTLDIFAPGWRDAVDHKRLGQEATRAAIFTYWCKLVEGLGFKPPKSDLVKGPGNQRLYWLAFISRNDIANSFWDDIRNVTIQPGFDF
jgi:three-Cys-motif partner protein